MSAKDRGKAVNVALLILRIGIGVMFLLHGGPKLAGGTAKWAELGGAMGNLGITFAPTFWGFCAALAEFGGGIALILGVLTRPAAAMMAFTMLVATVLHLKMGDGVMGASHAIEDGIVFVFLIISGAGAYSIDGLIGKALCGKSCCGGDTPCDTPTSPSAGDDSSEDADG